MGKFTKKFLGIMLALSLMGSGAAFATEDPNSDTPSEWANRDLSMSQTFKVASPDVYFGFRDQIDQETLVSVIDSLRNQLGLEATQSSKDFGLSRNDIINALYDVTKEAYTASGKTDLVSNMYDKPLVYFLSKGIITGDEYGFSLSRTSTREELIVIAERTYENIQRELGNSTSGLMWEVSDGDNTVYLFGSIHMANDKLYPLSKSIVDAYKKSDNLVVEADITKINDITAYLQSIMFIESNETVAEMLSAKEYKAYCEIMDTIGLPKEFYDKLDPWYSSLLISSLQSTDAIYSQEESTPALGLDLYFLMDSANKNVLELEGAKYQFDMMEGYSRDLQIESLRSLLQDNPSNESNDGLKANEDQAALLNKIFEYWKTSDSKNLGTLLYSDIEKSSESSATSKEYNDKMYFNRNNEMTEKVIQMISDEKENYFVVAGSAHMVGDTGIVQQLKDKGYTVTQIKN